MKEITQEEKEKYVRGFKNNTTPLYDYIYPKKYFKDIKINKEIISM